MRKNVYKYDKNESPKGSRKSFASVFLALLLVTSVFNAIGSIPVVRAQPYLTPKWTRTGHPTPWEGGLIVGDITGDSDKSPPTIGIFHFFE